MKRWIVMAAVVVTMAASAPSLANDGDDADRGAWCPINGTFVGQLPDWSMGLILSLNPDSPTSGSSTMQLIGGDPTLGGYFPTVVRLSTTLGAWRRTGARSLAFTMVHFGLDAGGQPVFIIKSSGAIVLAPGCMEYTGDGTFELYDASQDPLGGDPPTYGCYLLGSNYGKRVTVEAPCVP